MTRLLAGTGLWLVGCAVLFALAAWYAANGVASFTAAQMSGWAIIAAESRATYATFLAADPPLPYMLTYALQPLAAWGNIPPAALASVAVGALLCLGWYVTLRRAAFGIVSAALCTLLLIVNPLFLRAFAEGPAEMLLMLGVWLLAIGLFGLRARTEATDVMTTGFALAIIAFGHPQGLLLAVAALPFLALAAPPELLAKGAAQTLLLLIFPFVFALLGLMYVYWVFGGDGTAFLARFAAGLAGGDEAPASPALAAWLTLAGGLMAAPLAFVGALRERGRAPVLMAILALAAALIAAAVLRAVLGAAADVRLAAAPALALAAFAAAVWPETPRRPLAVFAALAVGAIGGASWLAANDTEGRAAGLAAWRAPAPLLAEAGTAPAAKRLAQFLADRDGILIDGNDHPDVVAQRGTTRGLILPGEDEFELDLLAKRLTRDHVAVRDPRLRPDVVDRVNRALPKLYLQGAPGYVLIYDHDGWRVYERAERRRLAAIQG